MKQKALHRPFELYVADMETWQASPLVYHFFEIVQILEGEGERYVNLNRFPYTKGSIFLFTPLDCRGFKMDTAYPLLLHPLFRSVPGQMQKCPGA